MSRYLIVIALFLVAGVWSWHNVYNVQINQTDGSYFMQPVDACKYLNQECGQQLCTIFKELPSSFLLAISPTVSAEQYHGSSLNCELGPSKLIGIAVNSFSGLLRNVTEIPNCGRYCDNNHDCMAESHEMFKLNHCTEYDHSRLKMVVVERLRGSRPW